AIMIVEYAGETEAEVRAKVETLEARRQRERFGYAAHVAHDAPEQASIWKLRKAGLGLLLGMKGDKKPIAFVEDTAVAPQHLAEFVSRFREIFAKQGGFAASIEMCNGVGACRKTLEGTMCPSYMATKDEEHSTRGRANALRAVLSGRLPSQEFTGRRLYEVMDLCLECKGCKAE